MKSELKTKLKQLLTLTAALTLSHSASAEKSQFINGDFILTPNNFATLLIATKLQNTGVVIPKKDTILLLGGDYNEKKVAEFNKNENINGLSFNVFYLTNHYQLDPKQKQTLEKLFKIAKQNDYLIHITGRADPRGPDSYNVGLVNRRIAQIIKLVDDAGIDRERVSETNSLSNKVKSNPEEYFFDRNSTILIYKDKKKGAEN